MQNQRPGDSVSPQCGNRISQGRGIMRTEVLVDHLGEVQFEVKARGHTVVCDQPVEKGGFDEGMTPPEFLLASLGTCAGFYAVQYLKFHHLPVEGVRIRASAGKVTAPARLATLRC